MPPLMAFQRCPSRVCGLGLAGGVPPRTPAGPAAWYDGCRPWGGDAESNGRCGVVEADGRAESVMRGKSLTIVGVNRPGVSGDSDPWEGLESGHVRKCVEEVPAGVAGAGGPDGRGDPC
jgi:hypothetical protein